MMLVHVAVEKNIKSAAANNVLADDEKEASFCCVKH